MITQSLACYMISFRQAWNIESRGVHANEYIVINYTGVGHVRFSFVSNKIKYNILILLNLNLC